MGLFTTSPIEVAIEKATSECLPNAQEDLASSMEACDMIRGKRVNSTEAMRCLKGRLLHRNPNVQMLALKLTDSFIKNTGNHFLLELTSKEFVDTLASLVRNTAVSGEVGKMATEYLQIWALLCKDEAGLGYIHEAYQELLRSGVRFPPAPRSLNKTMTKSLAPPEWIDGNQCVRCRVPFTLTLRKHHCRNCGNVFCQDCSIKSMALPEFGIIDPVRVCESCYVKKMESKIHYQKSAPLPVASPEHHDERTIDDNDSELELAIKLSLEESQKQTRSTFIPQAPAVAVSIPEPSHADDEERMLKAAIEASLKDSKVHEATSVTAAITDLEKENVKLFAQLVDRLSLSGAGIIEPEIEALSISMDVLKNFLRKTINESRQHSPELAGILATLEISLAKYQLLKQMPKPQQPATTTILPTPSVQALPYQAYPPPVPPQQYPAYTNYASTPSAPFYNGPLHQEQTKPAEGQLLDDEPLIKL